MNTNATAQMVTVSQGGRKHQPKPTAGEGMPGGYGKPWTIPTTGEWPEGADVTPWDMSSRDMLMRLSPLHNAALATERKKVRTLVDALEECSYMEHDLEYIVKRALAKVKV